MIHKKLFYIIVFLIPVNLGKHFVFYWSYVDGVLVDYLVPVLYLTDIFIIALVLVWAVGKLKDLSEKTKLYKLVLHTTLLLFLSLFFSTLLSLRIWAGVYSFFEIFLHLLLMLYTALEFNPKKDFIPLVNTVALSVLLLSFLGFGQWVKQSSVFDNFLFFGEQPYKASTPGIDTVDFFGVAKVPPYGLFRHPNIFGGFLSVTLLWILYLFFEKKSLKHLFVFLIGVLILFLTFSQTAWLAFVFGIFSLFLIKFSGKKGVLLSLAVVLFILVFGICLPLFSNSSPSFSRRALLEKAYLSIAKENILFGVGPNNGSILVEGHTFPRSVIRFIQPAHNIFIVLLAETGIFSLIFFLFLVFYTLYSLLKHSFGFAAALFVSILQFLILGSFDHYLVTIQQGQLIFLLTLGISLSYNSLER